ncbi:MAG TPA: DinB family protein [Verrucomicrobiae bacterium]|nr:DinB family protein [Verrucomicrobiae bacterium]
MKSKKQKTAKRTGARAEKKPSHSSGEKIIREQLRQLLDGGHAHIAWKEALADFPSELQGTKPQASPHTPWQLLEHMRIALWDILEFSRDPKHVSPQFPEGYWPPADTPPSPDAWEKSAKAFGRHLEDLKKLVGDSKINLFERIAHGDGQTILREALIAADHNAYHLGQLVLLRRMAEE